MSGIDNEKVKVSFDTWVQLLGMLGVLGGLVFVGLEMQQTQNIAILPGNNKEGRKSLTIFSIHLQKMAWTFNLFIFSKNLIQI